MPPPFFFDISEEADAIDAACEKLKKQNATTNSDAETAPFKKFNFFYLALKDHPKGKCFFFESDYKYVPVQGECPAVMYYDECLKGYVIRKYDKYSRAFETSGKQNVTTTNISKYNGTLIVDGIPYQFVRDCSSIMPKPSTPNDAKLFDSSLTSRTTEALQALQSRLEEVKSSQNLFLSKNDLRLVSRHANELEKKLNVILAKSKIL